LAINCTQVHTVPPFVHRLRKTEQWRNFMSYCATLAQNWAIFFWITYFFKIIVIAENAHLSLPDANSA